MADQTHRPPTGRTRKARSAPLTEADIPAHMVGCHNWTAEELRQFLLKHPAFTARQVHWTEHNAGQFPDHSPNDWRPL